MHPAFAQTDHRPWPVPARPWVMSMVWERLLFMHWPVTPDALQQHLPDGLTIDTFDGSAWLAVVPFTMTGVRLRFTPSIPTQHAFHELNVRTYVRDATGTPGVWFFSLDAANPVAVRTARATFRLPYFDARMALERDGDTTRYVSRRTHRGAPPATYEATYRPTGEPTRSQPGTIEHFVTERYCLFNSSSRGICRGDIQHVPWPLQRAECETRTNTMTEQLGLDLPDTEPLLHYAEHLDVVAWWPRPA